MGADEPYASVHHAYTALGPAAYYQRHGAAYRNPHEPAVFKLIALVLCEWPVDTSRVLDLAAGSGEITLALEAARGTDGIRIDATDPYTQSAYADRTGRMCEPHSFEKIAAGVLDGRSYSLVACSFAMHLAAPSLLPPLALALARVATQLLVITPHKRPVIRPAWGWTLTHEQAIDRVRARLYTCAL
jgi:hypothetical protein